MTLHQTIIALIINLEKIINYDWCKSSKPDSCLSTLIEEYKAAQSPSRRREILSDGSGKAVKLSLLKFGKEDGTWFKKKNVDLGLSIKILDIRGQTSIFNLLLLF